MFYRFYGVEGAVLFREFTPLEKAADGMGCSFRTAV